MMTQADILAENQETFKGVSLIGNRLGGFGINPRQQPQQQFGYAEMISPSTSAAPTNNTGDENSTTTTTAMRPTTLAVSEYPEITSSRLNEQSPIKPSKYFASDSAMNASQGLRQLVIGGLIFSGLVTIALIFQCLLGPNQVPNRIGINTQESVCSEIGADMVRHGGNSIDAYIASSLCLGVVNPFAAGLGAGGFLVVRDHKHNKDWAFNCFFKSSENIKSSDYLTKPAGGLFGQKSVAIPGELKCLQLVYHQLARKYWSELARPAIKLARHGFKVSKRLETYLNGLDVEKDIKSNALMTNMYLDSNGKLVKEGDLIKNLELADTLASISEYMLYHEDSVASDVLEAMRDENNAELMTMNDLTSYTALKYDSLYKEHYNDFVFLTTSFPSYGPILTFILDLMKELSVSLNDLKSSKYYVNLLQAVKAGYLLSSHIADPQFVPETTDYFKEKLSSARDFFNDIKNGNGSFPFDKFNVEGSKLVDDFALNFITVNDHNDIMVSYVGTLGSPWGSGLITKSGFMLNNGLNLFTFNKSDNNYNLIMPSKQPRALMAPILTYNQRNPCISRFCISYSHHGHSLDDFALSELTQVIMELFTDISLYGSVLTDKRLQYQSPDKVCHEAGFDTTILNGIEKEFKLTNKTTDVCTFHSIDLVMKKDHNLYTKIDTTRSLGDSSVLFNEK